MRIITSRPPNFASVLKVFPMAANRGVIFSYAPDIYAPGGHVPPELIAHEAVHIHRQEKIGVEEWWDLYLASFDFRYEEELLAHRAEYQHMISGAVPRQMRRSALKQVAKKLASPLYSRMVSINQAAEDIAYGT